MEKQTHREIVWIESAHAQFEDLSIAVQNKFLDLLTIVAQGVNPSAVKPLKGLGAGVYEIRISDRGNAYRSVYTLSVNDLIIVVHVFQKKSKKGISTPKAELDVIRSRLKQIKDTFS